MCVMLLQADGASLILMYIECVPAMVAMTQILYGYYTKFDELGNQWNSGIWLRKYTQCGPTTCLPIAQNIGDRKLWQSIAQKHFADNILVDWMVCSANQLG